MSGQGRYQTERVLRRGWAGYVVGTRRAVRAYGIWRTMRQRCRSCPATKFREAVITVPSASASPSAWACWLCWPAASPES